MIEERLQQHPGSRVLDLGPPTERKFQFFSRLRTRLYYNNFPDSLCAHLLGPNSQTNVSASDFQRMLPDSRVEYDVILAWDYLDYLTPENLRVVTNQLTQCSRSGTWIYFLMAQHSKIPDRPATIDLLSGEYIRYACGPATREGARYPPKVLEGLLMGFQINKLVLLKNGIQEHLFAHE